jgi:hypothetical protein
VGSEVWKRAEGVLSERVAVSCGAGVWCGGAVVGEGRR